MIVVVLVVVLILVVVEVVVSSIRTGSGKYVLAVIVHVAV